MKTFVVADLHFGHYGVCKFLREDGTKLRPWNHPDEMDEALVTYWNETVGPKDKVYVLGDFCINRRALPIAGRLNGNKILVKGNHDVFRLEEYAQYFQDVRACVVLHGCILTHIPVHTSQLKRFGLNVHGHLHAHVVTREVRNYGDLEGYEPDPRYMCVSVEQTNWRPLNYQVIADRIKEKA